jgi:signal peptidase I
MVRSKQYSLRRSRKILRHAYSIYKRRRKQTKREIVDRVEELLASLDQAILNRDVDRASSLAHEVEAYLPTVMRKSPLNHICDIGLAIVFALVVAVIVRQVWFEPYEIPSGSMRPTLEEHDLPIVSKTAFGLNVPLTAKHFYFNSDLLKRTEIFVFRPENMDLADTNHLYFFLFPGKKRYIKRCMGKPGDTIYFYGGQIYGIDAEGNDLIELRENEAIETIDHVPFLSFEGKVSTHGTDSHGMYTPVFFHQMDRTVARLTLRSNGEIRGQLFDGTGWVPDEGPLNTSDQLATYGDFWGIGNYAMARLLTPKQAIALGELPTDLISDNVLLYLELRHTPSLSYPKPHLGRDAQGRIRPVLTPNVTLVPLDQKEIDAILANLYTSRFIIADGYGSLSRGGRKSAGKGPFDPEFPGIPNGQYEFYHGKAYRIGWGAIRSELPPDHPLYDNSPQQVQKLFNLGIEMLTPFEPTAKNHIYYPSRYAYYRNGDLYLLGAPFLSKDDPRLVAFVEREKSLAESSPAQRPYIPFLDRGAPIKDGKLDVDFIREFGLQIPAKMYLALGDNYASSSDSRDFGFVPENNIVGTPIALVWPPGPRWGKVAHPPVRWVNGPRLVIWGIVLAILIGYWIYRRRNRNRPIFKKLSR